MHACTSDSIWADLQTTFKLSMSCPRFLVKTCIVRLKPRRDSWRQQLKVANKLSMSRGRPAGMVERELSPDEMAAVSAEISAGVPLDVLASLPLLTSSRCLDFLDRAAEKGIQKARLQEFHWLLKPLCSVEPRLILGHSSLQGVLRKVMETLMPILGVGSSDVLAGSLALDLRAMLSSLRKVRRNWKYQARAQKRDWPSATDDPAWEMLFELVQILQDSKVDETADGDTCTELERKRKHVMQELQGKTIEIVDEEPPMTEAECITFLSEFKCFWSIVG